MKTSEIKLKGLNSEETREVVPEGTILLGYRGSIAHGMYNDPRRKDSIDDKDLMGVFISPIEHYFGFKKKETRNRFIREWDVVNHELRKYVGLLCNANPNVLSLLWLAPNLYVKVDSVGQQLIDNRDLFSTKKLYKSFTGYAYSQLDRMEYKQDGEPSERYKKGYMGAKRLALVEKYGYDTKNASHLIRLLRMSIEFLTDGKIYVHRQDGPELMDIKFGEWSLEKIKEEAASLFTLAREAYVRCDLPVEVDTLKVEKLLVQMLLQHFDF